MRNIPVKFIRALKTFLFTSFFLLCALFINAQKTVTGVVKENGSPAVGASVLVKGTSVGASTGTNGAFTIIVPAGKNILVISSIGFDTKEVNVSAVANVDVNLVTATNTLNEVVVTGYTSQKKKEITGSVAVVNMKDVRQTPVGTGEEALQGRAAGVTIISSGQPGAASDIRIRGITAFGNNAPLIIVDGVRGNLHDININDIESMQVLKDASAAI